MASTSSPSPLSSNKLDQDVRMTYSSSDEEAVDVPSALIREDNTISSSSPHLDNSLSSSSPHHNDTSTSFLHHSDEAPSSSFSHHDSFPSTQDDNTGKEAGRDVDGALRRLSLDEYKGSRVLSQVQSVESSAQDYKRDLLGKLHQAEQRFRHDLEETERTVDPVIRQYKVRSLDMSWTSYEKYRQRAIVAGFITPSTSSQTSALSIPVTTDTTSDKDPTRIVAKPLECSDINLRLLPKWEADWKLERDLEAFLKNMSNFRKVVIQNGKRCFADSVALVAVLLN